MSNPTPKSTTNPTIVNALSELGLAENDAVLYQILLDNPDAAIPLLQQKSPFSRTMLYYVLSSLEQWGLLTKKEVDKKTVYNAEPPEKLEELVRDQEKELERGKKLLGEVIGDLKSSYRLAHNKPGVRFFEGREGVKIVSFDSLNAKEMIYTFADAEAIEKYGREENKEYVRQRISKKIRKKIIALDTPFTRKHYLDTAVPELTEIKLLPAENNPFKTGTQIYNNTVSFTTLTDKKAIGIIIEDENIAQTHRSLFEYVWSILPEFLPLSDKTMPRAEPPPATVQ